MEKLRQVITSLRFPTISTLSWEQRGIISAGAVWSLSWRYQREDWLPAGASGDYFQDNVAENVSVPHRRGVWWDATLSSVSIDWIRPVGEDRVNYELQRTQSAVFFFLYECVEMEEVIWGVNNVGGDTPRRGGLSPQFHIWRGGRRLCEDNHGLTKWQEVVKIKL